ncbi:MULTISPECIES: aldose 1-epimerase family protein [Rhizobium]|uniref:Aldose 1-epimerase family protein n=1 Tax=Rhizobium rhododendri TaxID=2506430 RepID=A0ABY8IJD6_9HYPH|nr:MULTISPECIES: aldose 1-epimerase family protein [Rhizobium]MBZ5760029.1 aldose 1-epimerase family protein [Rhizobium sp. VS19-DR96]MBZ5766490.1 aldose 1-epimerase family protein [Rhizobium sp. VS19-DR129.2]MBZ5774167.1 aldose 1-epimerase family protein [Rhizobium sp. VS19-DRK62.2]MBZ5785239.1 aldose 1-epimerase family protein [Rhizobium sp. VS19-DR121]MBZ5802838.1 aldose 1-epimerase family protein [Rhizobium sp. VS19-DR181]
MPTPIRLSNEFLTVDISSLGAEMQALTSADGRSYLWNGDAAFWTGRSPILFPIVGRAPDDQLTIDGKTYPMGQHGFARRSEFVLAASTATMSRHELAASAETRAVYPFEFRLAVEHRIAGRAVTVAAEVSNLGNTPMPFGLGFHSAFVWPLPGCEGKPHGVTLDNGAEPPLVRLQGGLVKPGTLPSPFKAGHLQLEHAMFDADAMIFPEGAGQGLTYGAEGGPHLRFAFENLPNLALWSKPGAPFLCVEPWHGTAAKIDGSKELADRPYSEILAPAATARFSFTVEIPA